MLRSVVIEGVRYMDDGRLLIAEVDMKEGDVDSILSFIEANSQGFQGLVMKLMLLASRSPGSVMPVGD